MTRKRYDEHGTEFSNWLREQTDLDSSLGYVATNLDYIWYNYKTDAWMLLEEKRYGGLLKLYQKQLFNRLDKLCRQDKAYRGFHIIVFQNTNPDDGETWIDGENATKEDLLDFLRFRRGQKICGKGL